MPHRLRVTMYSTPLGTAEPHRSVVSLELYILKSENINIRRQDVTLGAILTAYLESGDSGSIHTRRITAQL